MDDIISRLHVLDTPSVSDALDKLGLMGAVSGVVALTGIPKISGRVVTYKLGPPIVGGPKRHLGAASVMAAVAGEVIVVEHRGRLDAAGWGGLLSRGAKTKGIAGVIVDGAVRDVDEAREIEFPVFARAAVPFTARGRVSEHENNTQITFAGVLVRPGDLVLADGSGIVFIDQSRGEEVLATAEAIYATEQRMAMQIEAGTPIAEVMDGRYEDMLRTGAVAG